MSLAKRLCIVSMLICLVVACGSTSKPEVATAPAAGMDKRVAREFEQAVTLLGEGRHAQALVLLKNILNENPTTEFELVVLYNVGAAYEGMAQCQEAGRSYQKVARAALERYPRLQAEAIYRLSYTYECVGNDAMVVTSLLDARRRRDHLDIEIAKAEIPARLAAAYARVGNRAKAKELFQEAQEGIRTVTASVQGTRNQSEILARTLYFMGRLGPQEHNPRAEAEAFLNSLAYLQTYLLRSVELDHPVWSQRSADELHKSYDFVWKLIEQAHSEAEDRGLGREQQRQQRVRIVQMAIQSLRELKQMKFPGDDTDLVSQLFVRMDQQELRLQNYFNEIAVQTQRSPEAERREGLRREGRIGEPSRDRQGSSD